MEALIHCIIQLQINVFLNCTTFSLKGNLKILIDGNVNDFNYIYKPHTYGHEHRLNMAFGH